WHRLTNITLLGLLYCTPAALPLLLDAVETSPRRVADIVNVSSVAGRTVRSGSAVNTAPSPGAGAFTEALRQEVTGRSLRVSVVEPGAVETELVSHNRPEIRSGLEARVEEQERMQASAIAAIISFIVTRPRRTALNEVLVRPTDQER